MKGTILADLKEHRRKQIQRGAAARTKAWREARERMEQQAKKIKKRP